MINALHIKVKLVLIASTIAFSGSAFASYAKYSGIQAQELYRVLAKNPVLITESSGSSSISSDGTTVITKLLELTTKVSRIACEQSVRKTLDGAKSISHSCIVENVRD